MKIIIISGPSGSGKTILSNKLTKIFKKSIVIKTDSYYRDDLCIKFISLFLYDIYDRIISIKKDELQKTIKSICNKEDFTNFFDYDFKNKKSSKSIVKLKNNYKFIIIEGVYSHRLNLNYNDTINIICNEKEDICYQRRLIRDQTERGRERTEVNKKFTKSWFLYFRNLKKYINSNQVIFLNPVDQQSYNQLINRLKKFYIK